MLRLLITSSLISLGFAEGEMPDQDGVSWKEVLHQEAPKAWEMYYARTKGLQGGWSLTIRNYLTTKEIGKQYFEIKQRDGCAMVLEQTDKRGYLKVVNPKYAFELQRFKKNAAWVVAGVGRGLFSSTTFHGHIDVDDPKNFARLVNWYPYTFSTVIITLQVTVLDPGFSIKEVSAVTKGDQRLVKVDFDYFPPKDPARMVLRAGSVLFNPERFWTISSFEVQTLWGDDKGLETAHFEYKHADDGFPILKKVVLRRKIPNRKSDREFINHFDLHERDVLESDFYLTAFGFPEPKGAGWPKGPPWYLWFITFALVSLAVGWYLRRRVQRRKMLAQNATTAKPGNRP